ncbi:MAG: hypothetical protein U0704_07165 [Candidatus Eisenbacteria bacterium]
MNVNAYAAPPAAATRRDVFARLAFALALAAAAQLAFGALGFNPTDDGFVLAQARRLLDGELPHRDFVSVRPVGSALLHAGEVAWGGAYAFLWSRAAFWLELALSAWCWTELALRRVAARPGLALECAAIALGFTGAAHTFPAMAWHTVDGVLLASAGAWLACERSPRRAALGLALAGAAVTCKQNFAPLLPALVLLAGRGRAPWAWLAAAAAPLAYAAVLAAHGALGDAAAQLFALSAAGEDALAPFTRTPFFAYGALAGVLAATLAVRDGRVARTIAALLPCALALLAARALDAADARYLHRHAYAVLGYAAGFAARAAFARERRGVAALVACAALLGACASLSVGWRSPALALGAVWPAVLVAQFGAMQWFGPRTRALAAAAALALAAYAGVHFAHARTERLYHQPPRERLTFALGGVWPGGRGIVTDANTYAALAELRDAANAAAARGGAYAVLVDAPGWWACARERNPLPVAWAQDVELPTPALRERLASTLRERRGTLVLLVQRGSLAQVARGHAPIEGGGYAHAAALARELYPDSLAGEWWTVRH